ncbi:hypothetical protein GE09DRAFT_1168407 [Coniochaeta sp. 2T2.1]|nr:hypothetical protein GE09DRAFT_1168407 [Coniochaeta sp. 2T2.1]
MSASRFGRRTRFAITVLRPFFITLIVFLGVASYMFGSLFKSSQRAHNLTILAVDYDGGALGETLHEAYDRLRGDSFPTVHFVSTSDYPDEQSLREAVCSRVYWGAIYTHPRSTKRLFDAVSGNAPTYHPNDSITYIYAGTYYPVIASSVVVPSMQLLVSTTAHAIYDLAGKDLFSKANVSNPISRSALFQPISANAEVLFPAQQGTRILLNTVTMVFPALMQFFFTMAMNHIAAAFHLYTAIPRHEVYLIRLFLSKTFGLACALITSAYIFAFRESWHVTAGQFFETWMCFWLLMDICYLVMDTVVDTILPMAYVPYFVLTWIILGLTSTLYPFELNPSFYRWAYALPAHNIWLLLLEIWTSGCKLRNSVALPVLFVWWFAGHLTSAWSVLQSCGHAAGSGGGTRFPRQATTSCHA